MKNLVSWGASPNLLRFYNISIIQLEQEELYMEDVGEFWSLAGFKIKLTRRYSRYLYMYYLPSTLFVIVSWISFLIPPKVYPARVTLLITTTLVLVNIFNGVINNTASADDGLTALSVWIIATIFSVFSTFISYVIVLVYISLEDNREIRASQEYDDMVEQGIDKMNNIKSYTSGRYLIDYVMLSISILSFLTFSIIYYLNLQIK